MLLEVAVETGVAGWTDPFTGHVVLQKESIRLGVNVEMW